MKDGLSFQPLRQGRSLTEQLQQNRERLGSNRGSFLSNRVAINSKIAGGLEEIRSILRNELEVFIL